MSEAQTPVEEWPDEDEAPDDQPAIATVFAVTLIAAAVLFWPAPPLEGNRAMLVSLGVGTVAALLLWGIGWIATIRHASLGWKIGSLALIWIAAVVGLDRSMASAVTRLQADMATLDEIILDPAAHLSMPRKAERRGPVSRMFYDHFEAVKADEAATENAIGVLRFNVLEDAWRTEHDEGGVLDNCARAEKGKAAVRGFAQRQAKRATDLRARAQALGLPDAAQQRVTKAANAYAADDSLAELTALEAQMFDQWAARCTILARRRWKPWGATFMFTSNAEMAELRAVTEKHLALRQKFMTTLSTAMRRSGALRIGVVMP